MHPVQDFQLLLQVAKIPRKHCVKLRCTMQRIAIYAKRNQKRMNDIVDTTQRREEIMWENWQKQRQVVQEHHVQQIEDRYCIDCGERIPAARIKAQPDCVRCVDCQIEKEKGR